MNHLQEVIEKAWDTKDQWDMRSADTETREAVERTISCWMMAEYVLPKETVKAHG